MSFNPVQIELSKPARFAAFNTALARLLGDSFRKGALSPALTYAVGETGEGGGGPGGLPDVENFEAYFDPNINEAVLTWLVPGGDFTGYVVTCAAASINDTISDQNTNTVSYPLDPTDYNVDFLTFEIRTYDSNGQGDVSTAFMYFVSSVTSTFVELQPGGESEFYLNVAWSHPYDFYVNQYRIREDNFGLDQSVSGGTFSHQFLLDEAWRGQTAYFYITTTYADAIFDGKTSAILEITPYFIEEAMAGLGNNPGFYNPGLSFDVDVPTPLNAVATRSARLSEPITINYLEFGYVVDRGTISFWFNADAMGDTSGYGLFTTNSGSTDGYSMGLTSNGAIEYGMGPSSITYNPGDSSLLSGWHNIILTYSSFDNEGTTFNNFNMFIDGVQVQEDVQLNAGGNTSANWNDVKIGADSYITGNGGEFFKGLVVDFRSTSDQWGLSDAQAVFAGTQITGNSVRVIYRLQDEQEFDTGVIDSSTVYETPT